MSRTTGRSTEKIAKRVPVPTLAAAVVLAVGVAGFLTLRRDKPVQPLTSSQMIATGIGAVDSLALPDGTRVVLGPLSSLTVVKGYGAGQRDVHVRGYAFFDVVHNSSVLFTAHALNATITDAGTSFGVRTDSASGVSVTVRDGSVSLKPINTTSSGGVIVVAGQHGFLTSTGQAITRPAIDQDLAWLGRRLAFHEAPMSEVIDSFHRWYGIDLQLADPSLASRHLTATLPSESLENALELIHRSLGVEIARYGDTAIVRAPEESTRLR
jgi:transmembrane sensor